MPALNHQVSMFFAGCLLISVFFARGLAITAQCNSVVDSGQSCLEPPSSTLSTKYHFNAVSKLCEPFNYHGCGGNANRFDTLDECIRICHGINKRNNGTTSYAGSPFHPGPVVPQTTTTSVPSTDILNAKACGPLFAVVLTRPLQTCEAGTTCPEGYTCADSGVCCPTKETVCTSDYDSGHETSAFDHVGRYAFTASINSCNRFSYFGADGNFNNFKSYRDCMQFCR